MRTKKNKTLTDQLEQRLYEYIRENGYTYGDLLPKEEELAAELAASRTVTREALSRLKACGVIESRRRRGMVLKKPDIFSSLGKLIQFGMLDEVTRQEFSLLRLVIEVGLAELVYQHRTPEALRKLERIAEKFLDSSVSVAEQQQLELEFHSCLFAMSKNSVIESFQALLTPFFFEFLTWEHARTGQPHLEHAELVKVLKNGTAEEWRQAIYQHLQHYFHRSNAAAGGRK